MQRYAVRAMLVMAVLLMFAVPVAVQAAGSALAGTNWVLSTLNGQLPLAGTSVTLQLGADGAATGSDGCNRFTTTYTASRSTISFAAPAASTMMACTEAVMQQAADYMAALAAANRYQLRGGQLILLDDTTVLATFIAAKADLAGSTWLVTGYNNGREAVVSPLLGGDIIINIDDANLISGNAGCNDFFATLAGCRWRHRDRQRRRHPPLLRRAGWRHGAGGGVLCRPGERRHLHRRR